MGSSAATSAADDYGDGFQILQIQTKLQETSKAQQQKRVAVDATAIGNDGNWFRLSEPHQSSQTIVIFRCVWSI